MATHYDNLKVMRNAPPEVIRAAYKTLAQKYHPDRHGDKEEAERILKIINVAYDVLSDPEKRAAHDAWIDDQGTSEEQLDRARAKRSHRDPPPRPEPPPRQSYSPPPPPPPPQQRTLAPSWLVAACFLGLLALLVHNLNPGKESAAASSSQEYSDAVDRATGRTQQQVAFPPTQPSNPDESAWIPAVIARYPNWLDIVQSTEYDEWLKSMPEGIQALGSSKNADDRIALLDSFADYQKKLAKERERTAALIKLSTQHPDWKQVVASPEFEAWLKTKSEADQRRFAESNDPDYAGSVIAGFKGFRTLGQLQSPEKSAAPVSEGATWGAPISQNRSSP